MDELVEWLPAQLDAEERRADEIHHEDCPHLPPSAGYNGPFPCDCGVPERIRREIEAKRAILAQHTTNGKALCSRCVERWDYYHDGCEACADEPHEKPVMFVGRPCPTVLALAAIYSNRPGCRSEWRP